jgi:hypothetical protein
MVQIYEEYTPVTLAYTKMTEDNCDFINCLSYIVSFIDENCTEDNLEERSSYYNSLQDELVIFLGITKPSIRKAINQMIKLGFIKPLLSGYHKDVKLYLSSSENKRKILLSKIIYECSAFNSSFSKFSNINELKIIVSSIEYNNILSERELAILMQMDFKVSKGYYKLSEIKSFQTPAETEDFMYRKYNQIGYLKAILKKMNNIIINEEGDVLVGKDSNLISMTSSTSSRDGYLQRLYKNSLEQESREIYNSVYCMVEELGYPHLIASHIKPYSKSKPEEAFDSNNGLLLSKNIDALFDKGYISFDNNGNVICSEMLDAKLKSHLSTYKLESVFLNSDRCNYLDYHRENILKRAS